MFTYCVLLYGDYPKLAYRCLESLAARMHPLVRDVRVGLNAVSVSTRVVLGKFMTETDRRVTVYEPARGANVLKYPLMRKMLYGPEEPAEGVVWSDDDSWLDFPVGESDRWWRLLAELALSQPKPQVVGSIYTIGTTETQRSVARQQPWFAGRPFDRVQKFVTGGWWATPWAMLKAHDYPFRALRGNGGDVVLGMLCDQQGYGRVRTHGVKINASDDGRESGSRRRGESTPPLWTDGVTAPAEEFDYLFSENRPCK